ncbi:MAG: TVP38/TMEM64 family protein [Gemmatimonadetes bacterium]|nr:TVP38/TMEM64 family protein [Gemmatimonadota bacterium]MYG84371.1 TVP38/TMEM64 family protein [Gemmatimonadota bacterium]MYJ88246.1 TVP38/TMEM64 family protein [Gemmatimonadota bacterium]
MSQLDPGEGTIEGSGEAAAEDAGEGAGEDVAEATSQKRQFVKPVILLAIAFSGFLAYSFTPLGNYLQPVVMEGFFESIEGFWWAPLVFIGVYVLLTVLGLPMVILTFFAGFTFGALEGALYVMIGANIGANLAFDLARYLGRDFVSRYIKGPIDRIDRRLRKKGFLRMLQLRLIPVIPFNVLNFAAGLSGLRKLHFALATMIGITPGTFIYAYTAASLMQVYLAGAELDEVTRAALRSSALTNLIIALALLITISLAPAIYRKLRGKPIQAE